VGRVGRGKTFLIDLFFDALPIEHKRRTHFHRFMREVHAQLRAHTGERDPLTAIAKQWRQQLRVLVLDEFFVSDIGDAMLLARLLERLFAEGVVLVTSSNAAPQQMYKDGLQRARFLPAIALIERHCAIVHLDSPHDYRLRALTRSPVYRARWTRNRTPGSPRAGPSSARQPARGWPVRGRWPRHPGPRTGRRRSLVRLRGLCEGPRGTADYIELARECHTVCSVASRASMRCATMPQRRFVHLVDELYDRHVNLVCTADAAPSALYAGRTPRTRVRTHRVPADRDAIGRVPGARTSRLSTARQGAPCRARHANRRLRRSFPDSAI
jgi:cell division protein ZapE